MSATYAVVGSGASGIATAYYLQQCGLDVELIERNDYLGGRMASCPMGDRQIAMGGKNIGKGYHLFREFTQAMGDHPYEFFGLNSSQVRNGKIVTVDSRQRWLGLVKLLRQASLTDVIQFLRMCLAVKQKETNGYLGGPYFTSLSQQFNQPSMSQFFSAAFCQRLIRPMSVRMNGAEPDEVYLGNLGSNLRMVLDTYEQLHHGIHPVLEQFARQVSVRLATTVESLVFRGDRVVGLELNQAGRTQTQDYAGVILATPAPIAANLVAPIAANLAETLRLVRYYPVMVIVAEYCRNIFSEQVRALVFDADEPLSNAGAYGVNDRHIVRYTLSGRTARPYIESNRDTAELLQIAEATLNRHIPVSAADRVQFVSRRWSLGLCAYAADHKTFSQTLAAQLDAVPGLFLTGDYRQGASIEACFQAGKACAEQVARSHQSLVESPKLVLT
ncbi:MAG: protoporphyrinogen/coproporphyrinogen oxidase [Almyronema sp.]